MVNFLPGMNPEEEKRHAERAKCRHHDVILTPLEKAVWGWFGAALVTAVALGIGLMLVLLIVPATMGALSGLGVHALLVLIVVLLLVSALGRR